MWRKPHLCVCVIVFTFTKACILCVDTLHTAKDVNVNMVYVFNCTICNERARAFSRS